MKDSLMSTAANINQLKCLAKSRLPQFVFEYLTGGCNDDHAVANNRLALDRVYLEQHLLTPAAEVDTNIELLGQSYNAPFAVAPLGLSGLIWPKASLYHARAAAEAKIPFVLSTVASISIEKAAEAANEYFWFQLYPPTDKTMLKDLMRRADSSGCKHLVVTIDVPSLGKRPRDLVNGLSVPPRLSYHSMGQIMLRPAWALSMLRHGKPEFESIKPYLKSGGNMAEMSDFIRKNLKDIVDINLLKQIRDVWPHKLIVKGVMNSQDARLALEAGGDAIIVSNHGGRQLDASPAPIDVFSEICAQVADKIPVLADGGVESGVDLARFLSRGAKMVFSGRAMMYGVAAMGEKGAAHAIDILSSELQQVMQQLRCETPNKMTEHQWGEVKTSASVND